MAAAAALAACGGGNGSQAVIAARIPITPHVGPDVKVDGEGSVWLPASDSFGGTEVPYPEADHFVVRVSAESERVTARVPMPHPMVALAIGEGAVWATGTDFGPGDDEPDGSLVRIDPGSETVTGSAALAGPASPTDVAVGFGSVWVVDSTADVVYRVDPDTVRVVAEIAVDGGPSSLAVTADAVWVSKPATGEIRAIDPETNQPQPAVGVGPVPDVLEAGGAGLWVARYTPPVLHQIDTGRARVAETVEFPSAPSRFAVGEDVLVVVETEGEVLSIVRGGSRREVLDGRRFVAVAVADGDRTAWAVGLDGGSGRLFKITLPSG